MEIDTVRGGASSVQCQTEVDPDGAPCAADDAGASMAADCSIAGTVSQTAKRSRCCSCGGGGGVECGSGRGLIWLRLPE